MQEYAKPRTVAACGVFAVPAASVRGTTIISVDGTGVWCSEAQLHPIAIKADLAAASPPTATRAVRKAVLLVAGHSHKIYGHWLVDYMPKLWVLQQAGYDLASIQFLWPRNTLKFARAFFDAAGIRPDQIFEYDPGTEQVEAEELIIPTLTRFGNMTLPCLPAIASFLVDRIGVTERAVRKIFLARPSDANGPVGPRPLVNRREVEAVAASLGYEIVHPQRHTIVDQISLFRSATHVAGEYGSALHNSIFSRPGTVVCAIRGAGKLPGFLQSSIGERMRQPTGYVFGALINDRRAFLVDADLVREALEQSESATF